jgi:hypothetical protein
MRPAALSPHHRCTVRQGFLLQFLPSGQDRCGRLPKSRLHIRGMTWEVAKYSLIRANGNPRPRASLDDVLKPILPYARWRSLSSKGNMRSSLPSRTNDRVRPKRTRSLCNSREMLIHRPHGGAPKLLLHDVFKNGLVNRLASITFAPAPFQDFVEYQNRPMPPVRRSF